MPKPGPVGDGDEAFRIVENGRIGQVVKQVIAHVVVDTEALLLDDGVVRAAVDLQGGGKRMGPRGQCSATATSYASASVAILRVSVMPPACEGSGWMMSTAPLAKIDLKSHRE
jgi:hypothetical protein